MKRILLAMVLATLSTTVIADGYRGHGHHNGNEWLAPLIVGGAIGYIIAQPRIVVQQPQYAPLPIYLPANEPIYQYQNIYDGNCACYRRVLVQIN